MMTEPGFLITLIPVGIVVLGFVTFEIAMAITISTLPRSRFRQKWTTAEQRRVLRVFCLVFSVWPIVAAIILSHVYLPIIYAIGADALLLVLVVLAVRWMVHGARERRLIAAGHCENCFYDLRASRESEHCPECGTTLHDHPTRLALRR